jgi:hypothetical protein
VNTYAAFAFLTEYNQFRVHRENQIEIRQTSEIDEIENALLLHLYSGTSSERTQTCKRILEPTHIDKNGQRFVSFPMTGRKKGDITHLLGEIEGEEAQESLFEPIIGSYTEAFIRSLRGKPIENPELDVFIQPETLHEALTKNCARVAEETSIEPFYSSLGLIRSLRLQNSLSPVNKWRFTIEPNFGFFTGNGEVPYTISYR